MTDSRYAPPHSGRHSPIINPARLSMPVVPTVPSAAHGFSPYAGALPILPPGHYDAPPRRQTNPPPTGTYQVNHDPMSRGSSVRQVSNGPSMRPHRSSTVDSNTNRPIIVTTTAPNRPHAGSSHSSGKSSDRSPAREPHHATDDQYYFQPASSTRSRSSHRLTYSTTVDNDDLRRLRDRTADPRHLSLGDPYRAGRGAPGPIYSNLPPRQKPIPAVEDGYEYTNPSDLARYDLEHTPSAPGNSRRRRESLDRGGYYRPSVFVNAGYDRTRPPPVSRGLDKYNWNAAAGIYDNSGVRMPVPPPVPLAPPLSDSTRRPDPTMSPIARRERPTSMYLERPNHDHSYYLPREEERHHRERREPDREYDRPYDANYFHDENVTSRGFGIRTDDNYDTTTTAPPYRRPGREYVETPPEPQRRSDEDPDRRDDRDRRAHADRERRHAEDDRDRERRSSKEERDPGRSSLKDKTAAGLGAAAQAEEENDAREESRRHRNRGENRRDERHREPESREQSRARHGEREPEKKTARIAVERDDADHKEKERDRRDAEAKLNGDSASSSGQLTPTSEEEREATAARSSTRTKVASFKPTDTADLLEVKAKLAEMRTSDDGKDKGSDSGSVKRSPSPEKRAVTPTPAKEENDDESRGRELVKVPEKTEKQVRVVSPPREKNEPKRLKGILKTPSQKFPEEPNPVREGVAPHKDDKTKKDAPAGARWTKIRRDIVNPEALTAGKERFEVRDDFVIVLRVLNKEEIEQYAYATQLIREKRHEERLIREKRERESERDRGKDHDRDDDERRRHHRQHRREEETDERKYRERDYSDRDRERHRRHRYESEGDQLLLEDAPKQIEYPGHNHGVYHRSHREREREMAKV